MNHNGKLSPDSAPRWAVIQGSWDITGGELVYKGGAERYQAHGQLFPMGLVVSNRTMQHGRCRVDVEFAPSENSGHFAGGLVIGYRAPERYYLQVQFGAGPAAYSVSEFVPGFGWKPLDRKSTRELQSPMYLVC